MSGLLLVAFIGLILAGTLTAIIAIVALRMIMLLRSSAQASKRSAERPVGRRTTLP